MEELRILKGNKNNLPSELDVNAIYVATSSTNGDYSALYVHGEEWHSKQYTDTIKKELDFKDNDLQRQVDIIKEAEKRQYISPLDDETPKIFWEGELPTAKADGEYRGILLYVSKNETLQFYATLTVQGSSSVNYPKKNFTIKFYADETYSEKIKVRFKDWGLYDSLVMKANWVDHSHIRIVGTSEIWKQVMESRNDFETLPEEIRTANGHGATLGWSFRFYVEGLYYGLYEMIIAKKNIFGQTKKNPLHSILISEYNNKNLCVFDKSVFTNTEFNDCWSEELQSEVSETARTSFGNIIKLISNGTDEEIAENLPNMIDIQSVIDFDIFARVFILRDNIGKNQIFASYDGEFWYEGAWDLDWSLNGSSTSTWQTDYQPYVEAQLINKLYSRVEQIWLDDFKARYWELRKNVLNYNNITSVFEKYNDCVATWLEEDYAPTTGKGQFIDIPGKTTSNIQQIRNAISYRLKYMDNVITNMVVKVDPIMISVNKQDKLFTLSCETSDVTIYYTLDGTVPTTASSVYSAPTSFEFGDTLKAIGVLEGSDDSDMLNYTFEEDEYYEITPYKRIFGYNIRANEKDISPSKVQFIAVYKNDASLYPLKIKGKYVGTSAKYAFVNSDFLDNPTTENLVRVEGKYPYDASMKEPLEVDTEITEYVNTPYIAIVVIMQGNNISVDEDDWFKLYTTNEDGKTNFSVATQAKVFTNKSLLSDKGVTSSTNYDIALYDNIPTMSPYVIKGQQMTNNAVRYFFANEDFYNNPITENIIKMSSETYPYNGAQIVPKYYETPIGVGNVDNSAKYIGICVNKNSNVLEENRFKLYMKS